MPIYEYRRPDGTTFEVQQSFTDDPLSEDPETGVPVQRVLHAPAVHFKGKGFYNTDYGTRKRQRETAAAGEGSSANGDKASASEGSGAADTPSKSDSTAKTESKKEPTPAKASAKPDAAKPVAAAK